MAFSFQVHTPYGYSTAYVARGLSLFGLGDLRVIALISHICLHADKPIANVWVISGFTRSHETGSHRSMRTKLDNIGVTLLVKNVKIPSMGN